MTMEQIKPSRWLSRLARDVRILVLLVVGCGLSSGGLLIVQASMVATVINQVFIYHQAPAHLWHYFAILLAAVGLRALLAWLREILGFYVSVRIRKALRLDLVCHAQQCGPITMARYTSGEWSSLLLENVEALHGYYAHFLPQMMIAVCLPLVILVVVFPLSWLAGLLLLVTMPLIPFFMAIVGMGAASLNQKNFEALSRMSAHFLDVLQGLTTLKLFGRARALRSNIYQVSEAYRQRTMSVLYVAFLSSGVLEFFAALSVALLATYLGLALLGHIHVGFGAHLSLYTALFILILAPEFYMPLRELNTHYHSRAQAIGAAKALIDCLNEPTQAVADQSLAEPVQHITLQAVTVQFAHRSMPALADISGKFVMGRRYGIVGSSGAGKSTLTNLLLGFLAPKQGIVYVDQVNLAQVDRTQWLSQIAWLGQQPRLPEATIRDNLLMANPQADDQQCWQALQLAGAAEFVSALPQGLATPLYEQRIGLSGGQMQRVALARMVLKEAPIWILDEPTASLDGDTLTQLMAQIEQLSRDKLVILVTHNLSALSWVDDIWVMDQGCCVQQGTFTALQRQSGLFRELLLPAMRQELEV